MGTWLKRIELGALALVVLCAVAVFAVDAHVRSSAGPGILSVDEAAALGDVDCVLVLGCGVHPDGRPSDMLADRIACGVALYENGTSPKLLMSGDHGRADYDEVTVMREAAVQAGLPKDDVFMDHAWLLHLREHVPGATMCSGRSASWLFPKSTICTARFMWRNASGLTPPGCRPTCALTPGSRPARYERCWPGTRISSQRSRSRFRRFWAIPYRFPAALRPPRGREEWQRPLCGEAKALPFCPVWGTGVLTPPNPPRSRRGSCGR